MLSRQRHNGETGKEASKILTNRFPIDLQLTANRFPACECGLSQRRAFKVFKIVPISQLGQIGDDGDATCDASSRGVYRYVEVKGHCMLLSQRSDMPQLQEKGTHPVRCQTRQSSPVMLHLHVCKRRTFVTSFSAYSNIRLQKPLLHVMRSHP